MSKFFHLSKKSRKVYHKKKLLPAMKINTKTINVIIAVMVVTSFVSYLVQVNGLATKGYQIQELEDKIAQLAAEQADLEFVALSLQSMGAVKEKVDELGLVAIGESDYLTPTPVALAR